MTTPTIRHLPKRGLGFFASATAVAMVLGMSALSAPLLAQDDAETEDSAELEALKERAAILEQELKILQTENQLIEARFGAAATPLDGTIETEGDAPIESQVLAYEAVDEVAGRIAEAIGGDVKDKPVVIYDAAQVAAVQSYVAFLERLKLLAKEYDRTLQIADDALSPEEAAAGFEATAIVAGVASSVAGVLGLFRTDLKVTSKTLTIDDLALIAAVASRLTKASGVYHPALAPLDFATPPVPPPLNPDDPTPEGMSELLAALNDLDKQRQQAADVLKQLAARIAKIKKLDKEIADLAKRIKASQGDVRRSLEQKQGQKEEEKAEAGEPAELEAAKKGLEAVNAIYQAIRTGLIAGGSNTTAMLGLLNAERVGALLRGNALLLHLKMAAASGTTQTSNNLFAGSRLRHSGGAIATYVLFEAGGKILKSGNAPHRGEPKQFKKWEKKKEKEKEK